MVYLDWQESVRNTVSATNGQRKFYYRMPRQIGVSTFLRAFALERHQNGESIVLVTSHGMQNKDVYPILSKRQFMTSCRGKSYDWIILDTLGETNEQFTSVLYPCASQGKILSIDTVEGT